MLKMNAYGLPLLIKLLAVKDPALRAPVIKAVEEHLDELDEDAIKAYEKASGKTVPPKPAPAAPAPPPKPPTGDF